MISPYAISGKVWLVRTDEVAQVEIPTTLPLGSIVLSPDEAQKLYFALGAEISKALAQP